MPADQCREFFALHAENREVVKVLQSKSFNIDDWESSSASDHSPGPVKNHERLFRQVVSPNQVDAAARKLKPSAIDDAANKGLSVDRATYKTRDEVVAEGRKRAAEYNSEHVGAQPRALFAVVNFDTAEVRSLADEAGQRLLGVFDTADCGNAAHADVMVIVSGKHAGRSARSKLLDLANRELDWLP